MGVKQHCIGLERDGYLDTWRRPKGMGRPEKAYRLTDGAREFFPSRYPQFSLQILESVKEIYGSLGPEKILHNIYKAETQRYEIKLQKLEENLAIVASPNFGKKMVIWPNTLLIILPAPTASRSSTPPSSTVSTAFP